MNVFSKSFVALIMAMTCTASHATCINANGVIEGNNYSGAADMLPACERSGERLAGDKTASEQMVVPKEGEQIPQAKNTGVKNPA